MQNLLCSILRSYEANTLSCHNSSFLINEAPLFKRIAFNVALFDVALFNLALFDIVLFDVELF